MKLIVVEQNLWTITLQPRDCQKPFNADFALFLFPFSLILLSQTASDVFSFLSKKCLISASHWGSCGWVVGGRGLYHLSEWYNYMSVCLVYFLNNKSWGNSLIRWKLCRSSQMCNKRNRESHGCTVQAVWGINVILSENQSHVMVTS